jgi:1,4-alpha-glucan branching enzyme
MRRADVARSVTALLSADHPDPFSFLGMHGDARRRAVVVRTFLPEARKVAVVDAATGSAVAELPRVDEAGFFAGPVKGRRKRFDYRLRVVTADGESDLEDPYRFPPILGEMDVHLLAEGSHQRSFEKLGAHPTTLCGVRGVAFAVWAPNARRVSVVGDFNDWDGRRHPMRLHPGCGVWEIFLPGVPVGAAYKFEIKTAAGELLLKADPYAFEAELRPRTASVVRGLGGFEWGDDEWMAQRARASERRSPVSIYEVHLGSWRRKPEEGDAFLTYGELADQLIPYVRDMGFTHIELLPVSEHPFDGSWGYQPTGLFAPTRRFGTPSEFRAFVDRCHREGVGVLVDWVPGHFPSDLHGLARFDGTHLYEHADPRQGVHSEWDTLIYNFGRNEVAGFLLSSAQFWMEQYHVDGLRVDAVASMLYLDYGRRDGEWVPNPHGGNENLEAVAFIKRTNELVYGEHSGTVTIAEESTAWPMVSRPTYLGGLGFGYKWNMGWMNDTLRYMSKDPVHRKYHHGDLTFALIYAFEENFILPLSHDEVVHGKGSLLGKMPGDRWQKFANLRAYLAFMYTHPGKKLLFMGSEFAQEREWNHDASLDWHLLDDPVHQCIQTLVKDLNRLYVSAPALHELDCEGGGFSWIDCHDHESSVISYLRSASTPDDFVVVVCNFTPVVREGYRVGVPRGGYYAELLNTDSSFYGGSDVGNGGGLTAHPRPTHGMPFSLDLRLPPLATLVLRPEGERGSGC